MASHNSDYQLLIDEANTMIVNLTSYHRRLRENTQLAKLVPFSVQQRGQRERNRLGKLFLYKGSDPETLRILRVHSPRWDRDPSLFGSPPTMSDHGNRPIDDITASLWIHWAPSHDFDQLKAEVASMMEAGSRYRNMDAQLGFGASLVLGTALPETIWTKLLPKKGAPFENAMKHLRDIGIPNLALRYKNVFEKVLEYELSALKVLTQVVVPIQVQNLLFDNYGEVEDGHAYPTDASLAELGLDHFALLAGPESGLVESILGQGGDCLGNDFDSSMEEFGFSNMQIEGNLESAN